MDAIGYAEAFCNELDPTFDPARRLGSAVGVWRKYRFFLQVALGRYQEVHRERGKLVQHLFQERAADENADEIMRNMNNQMALTAYEVECVYVFLKILLDRTAETFAIYFGLNLAGRRGGSTHRRLADRIDAIAYSRGLIIDRELVRHMRRFIGRVIDYRNDAIEHVDTLHSLVLATLEVTADGAGGVQVSGAGGRVSESPEILAHDVDQYMIMLVDCFEANRSKARCAEPPSAAH